MRYRLISVFLIGFVAVGMVHLGTGQAKAWENQEASAEKEVRTVTAREHQMQQEMVFTTLAAEPEAQLSEGTEQPGEAQLSEGTEQPGEAQLSEGAEQPGEARLVDETQKSEDAQRAGEEQLPEETQSIGEEESEYADFAIADVSNYVNVRALPGTDGEIVGKIYDGAVAQILEVSGEEEDWLRIVSGNVEGYIKAEFFLYGDAAVAVIDDYVTRYAVVLADRLNVREEPKLDAKRIGYIDNGEKVRMLEDQGEWLKVQYTDGKTGYVAAEYVSVSEEFIYAKTLEEEAAEIAARRALEERQHVEEAAAAENVSITVEAPSGDYSSNSELRNSLVEYAMQFLGNKYIHGGKTLEGGTDCSGFTSLLYAEFGYSVSRTPSGQLSGDGRSISYSEIQPGDIICYGSGTKCTHVAMYIGDGQIIHSANSKKGVVIYNADYDTIMGVKNIID